MKSTTIAVDLAKSIFEVAVSYHPGQVSSRHRLTRARLLGFFLQQPAATVVLEACGSAHHWARQLEAMGHSYAAQHPFPRLQQTRVLESHM